MEESDRQGKEHAEKRRIATMVGRTIDHHGYNLGNLGTIRKLGGIKLCDIRQRIFGARFGIMAGGPSAMTTPHAGTTISVA